MRACWALCAVQLAACRFGFDELDGPSTVDDASRVPGDALVADPDALLSCMTSPTAYLAITQIDDYAGTIVVSWCSANLAGPLVATLFHPDRATWRDMQTLDVATASCTLVVGGASCNDCFVRLDASGVVAESEPLQLSGD